MKFIPIRNGRAWCRTYKSSSGGVTSFERSQMNMNFQRPGATELRYSGPHLLEACPDTPATHKSVWRKYLVPALIFLGIAYFAIHASGLALLIAGGVAVALVGVAAYVCVTVQNETP
jgi:hypothetical protein